MCLVWVDVNIQKEKRGSEVRGGSGEEKGGVKKKRDLMSLKCWGQVSMNFSFHGITVVVTKLPSSWALN